MEENEVIVSKMANAHFWGSDTRISSGEMNLSPWSPCDWYVWSGGYWKGFQRCHKQEWWEWRSLWAPSFGSARCGCHTCGLVIDALHLEIKQPLECPRSGPSRVNVVNVWECVSRSCLSAALADLDERKITMFILRGCSIALRGAGWGGPGTGFRWPPLDPSLGRCSRYVRPGGGLR